MRRGNRIWHRRAGLLVAAGVFLLSNLAFLFGYHSMSRARKGALEARHSSLRQEVGSGEAEASKLVSQRNRVAGVASAIEEFYNRRIGTRRATLAPVVQDIHAATRLVGASPKQISYSIRPVSSLPLAEMLIGFGFQGDYAQLKRLLRSLEANPRWIAVREISLSRDSEQPGRVEVRLLLATYFSGEETRTASPAEGAGRAGL